jgi:hypothetical protein
MNRYNFTFIFTTVYAENNVPHAEFIGTLVGRILQGKNM